MKGKYIAQREMENSLKAIKAAIATSNGERFLFDVEKKFSNAFKQL